MNPNNNNNEQIKSNQSINQSRKRALEDPSEKRINVLRFVLINTPKVRTFRNKATTSYRLDPKVSRDFNLRSQNIGFKFPGEVLESLMKLFLEVTGGQRCLDEYGVEFKPTIQVNHIQINIQAQIKEAKLELGENLRILDNLQKSGKNEEDSYYRDLLKKVVKLIPRANLLHESTKDPKLEELLIWSKQFLE